MTERQLATLATGVAKLHRNHTTIVITTSSALRTATDRVVLIEYGRVTTGLVRAEAADRGAVPPVTERVMPIEPGHLCADDVHAEATYRTAVLS